MNTEATRQRPPGERLLGRWCRTRTEGPVDRRLRVLLEFRDDGTLLRVLGSRDLHRVLRLDYLVTGSFIVCGHPASTQQARIGFAFEPDGSLRLDGEGGTSWYRSDPPPAAVPDGDGRAGDRDDRDPVALRGRRSA